jgi:hypothetical protein
VEKGTIPLQKKQMNETFGKGRLEKGRLHETTGRDFRQV